MAEALKNRYSTQFIEKLSFSIKKEFPDFDQEVFVRGVLFPQWNLLGLKQRTHHIAQILHETLPENYEQALAILIPASAQVKGYEWTFFPDYVASYGLEYFEPSMKALSVFTIYSTSEFAVRPFIIRYGKKMMHQMLNWSLSENEHIRRLASEGCRPRLPWASALTSLKENPESILPILENLKHDPSEYVRRSVANNLNDISKDHPELVTKIAHKWFGNHQETDRLVKHACRTLLKQGRVDVLSLFGYEDTAHIRLSQFTVSKTVLKGKVLNFSFTLETSESLTLGRLRLEYAITFFRPGKSQGRKVFKISEGNYQQSRKSITKQHSFRAISTRRYYAGKHQLELIVNGQVRVSAVFFLIVPELVE